MQKHIGIFLVVTAVNMYASEVRTSSTSTRTVTTDDVRDAAQEGSLAAELVGAFLQSKQLTPQTRTRLGNFLAGFIAQEERKIEDKKEFARRLADYRTQLDQANEDISDLVSAGQLAAINLQRVGLPGLFRGKHVSLLRELLQEIEGTLMSRKWGFIPEEAVRIEKGLLDASQYVNEDSIAGSWFVFLGNLAKELLPLSPIFESPLIIAASRSRQAYVNSLDFMVDVSPPDWDKSIAAYKQKIQSLVSFCELLKEAARDKKIDAEYRGIVQSFLQPITKTSNAEASKRRRIQE